MTAIGDPRADVPLVDRLTVTASEACRLFGVGPSTFRQWAQTPGFPRFVPPGAARPLYPVAALRQWVAERTEVAA